MKRIILTLLLIPSVALAGWNPNRPAGSDTFGESHGLIRSNWWAIDSILQNLWTGQGFWVSQTGHIYAPSINTGAGPVQVWQMNQPVRTTDSVAFSHVTTQSLAVVGGDQDRIDFSRDSAFIAGPTDAFLLTIEGNLASNFFTAQTGALTHLTAGTLVADELEMDSYYWMDQAVRRESDVEFGSLSTSDGTIGALASGGITSETLLLTGTFTGVTGNFSGALSAGTLNTGQGNHYLYAMDQAVKTDSAVTFETVDTGQGAHELYAMDQDVQTTSNVEFATMSVGSLSAGAISTGPLSADTLNTGQGDYELYAMDQDVQTTDDVVFNRIDAEFASITLLEVDSFSVEGAWTGWVDDGANFRMLVQGGLITSVGDSVAGGYKAGDSLCVDALMIQGMAWMFYFPYLGSTSQSWLYEVVNVVGSEASLYSFYDNSGARTSASHSWIPAKRPALKITRVNEDVSIPEGTGMLFVYQALDSTIQSVPLTLPAVSLSGAGATAYYYFDEDLNLYSDSTLCARVSVPDWTAYTGIVNLAYGNTPASNHIAPSPFYDQDSNLLDDGSLVYLILSSDMSYDALDGDGYPTGTDFIVHTTATGAGVFAEDTGRFGAQAQYNGGTYENYYFYVNFFNSTDASSSTHYGHSNIVPAKAYDSINLFSVHTTGTFKTDLTLP